MLSISARDTSSRRTTVVLLSATIAPMARAVRQDIPKNNAVTVPRPMVTMTCAVPPPSAAAPNRRNLCQENSRPIVNSNKATPSSANALTSDALEMN